MHGSALKKQCTFLFECQCIWNENTNWGHYFYVSWWRRDRHFTWSSKPREGLAACSAKEVPSFLSHFKTLSNGPAPGIEPATSRSAVKRSTDWANPATVDPIGGSPFLPSWNLHKVELFSALISQFGDISSRICSWKCKSLLFERKKTEVVIT